jgi:aspartate-semialdehyde dehydrogenase
MKVAVIGATGAVGRAMVQALEKLPEEFSLGLFSTPRSAGESFDFKGLKLRAAPYSLAALHGYDYALLSVSGDFSKAEVPKLAEAGVVCIDNSSAFRKDLSIPLVVPSVNGDSILDPVQPPRIVANPNCSTIQLVAALKPLKEAFGLKEVVISTYQSTSGAGAKGIEDLAQTVKQTMAFQPVEPRHFPVSPAFNVIPGIGDIDAVSHYCVEELKLVHETRRLLSMPNLMVLPTTARVATFNCHCESVTLQLAEKVTRQAVIDAWKTQEDVVWNDSSDYRTMPSPLTVVGKDESFVARLRLPPGMEASDRIQFWCVVDNVLKGAATNAVQILSLFWQRP